MRKQIFIYENMIESESSKRVNRASIVGGVMVCLAIWALIQVVIA